MDQVYEQKRVDLATYRVDLANFYAIFPSAWIRCSQMLYFLQFLSTTIEPNVAKWTRFCPLKNDKNAISEGKKAKLPNRPVFTPPHMDQWR